MNEIDNFIIDDFYCEICEGELILIETNSDFDTYKCDCCGHVQIIDDPTTLPKLDRREDIDEEEDN